MSFVVRRLASLALLTTLTSCQQDSHTAAPIGFTEPDEPHLPDGGFTRTTVPVRLSGLMVAERAPPPISGGTLTASKDGKVAVVADPDRDAVYVVDVGTNVAHTVALPAGSEPGRVVLDAQGRAHVALRGRGMLAQIELATGTLLKQTALCQHPRGLAHDTTDDSLWLACAGGELVHVKATDHGELGRIMLGLDLRDVVITKDGARFVSRYRSAELLRVDADGQLVDTTSPPVTDGFDPLRGTPLTRSPTLAWRTVGDVNGKVLMLHQHAQNEEILLKLGGYGGGCQTITHTSVTQFGQDSKVTGSIPLAAAALTVDVASSGDGRLLALATPGAYLRGERGSLLVLPADILSLGLDATEWPSFAPRPGKGGGDAGVPFPEARGASPEADVAQAPSVPLDAGLAPPLADAGFASADAGRPMNCVSGAEDNADLQVTAVAFDDAGHLFAFSREPARLLTYTVTKHANAAGWELALVASLDLSQASVRDTGHELFHADVGSGLACASCHGEALDDGHVWTFSGFGARRTQNMRGGLLSTLPLHWEGDMPTFKHLVDEVMTGRMSGFPVESRYADALANWIDSQPELKLHASDPDAAARGQALFAASDVGCASCHAGALLTNNQTVEVGTGGRFQVPSLLGLGLRGPYMHDGCAKTLSQRFDPACGGGDQHGKTSHLSAAQIHDLTVYLQTL